VSGKTGKIRLDAGDGFLCVILKMRWTAARCQLIGSNVSVQGAKESFTTTSVAIAVTLYRPGCIWTGPITCSPPLPLNFKGIHEALQAVFEAAELSDVLISMLHALKTNKAIVSINRFTANLHAVLARLYLTPGLIQARWTT